LTERFSEVAETQPELLAHHYMEAGLGEQAIAYWQQAGQHALQRSANSEAVQHLTRGLALLATLPETPRRAQQELDLQLALGPAWIATKGRSAPEVEQTYARALAAAQGFPSWAGYGTFWQGWALAARGQDEAGLAQMRQGIAAVWATGQALARPFGLVLLAETSGRVGQVEEGLRLVAEALEALEANTQGDMPVEAHRLQGELLLRQATPDAVQAEACFQQALTIARHQQAQSWERRAATSLACLWQHQGKRAEAYELLAPVYGWFTEGFDTADLQEAKALLEALA
jgi:predicted ATPase